MKGERGFDSVIVGHYPLNVTIFQQGMGVLKSINICPLVLNPRPLGVHISDKIFICLFYGSVYLI